WTPAPHAPLPTSLDRTAVLPRWHGSTSVLPFHLSLRPTTKSFANWDGNHTLKSSSEGSFLPSCLRRQTKNTVSNRSLRSYPINPSRSLRRVGFKGSPLGVEFLLGLSFSRTRMPDNVASLSRRTASQWRENQSSWWMAVVPGCWRSNQWRLRPD